MGKITGFLEIARQDRGYEKPDARKANYREFVKPLPYGEVGRQGRGNLVGRHPSLIAERRR